MTKLEQVIKALQLCRYDPDPGQECKFLVSCDICPYWNDEVGCREIDLFNDALELLKEQEPKPVLPPHKDGIYLRAFAEYIAYCPNCKQEILEKHNKSYCGFCGQAVKWNDEA